MKQLQSHFILSILLSVVAGIPVDNTSCPIQDPPVIFALSFDDSTLTPPIDSRPNITDFTGPITPLYTDNSSCCVTYSDNGETILMCTDLQSALNGLGNFNISTLTMYIGQVDTKYITKLNYVYEIELVSQLYLYGYGDVTIDMPGLQFIDVNIVSIHRVSFTNGGITFQNCFNVLVDNVRIRNSMSAPSCAVIWDNPQIINYTINPEFTFTQCSFQDNGGPDVIGGGALFLFIQENFNPVTVLIENCTFTNNSAKKGGALLIDMKNLPLNKECSKLVPAIFVSNSLFSNNFAQTDGGAIHLAASLGALYGFGAYKNVFIQNAAKVAGGAVYLALRNDEITCESSPYIEFYECDWIENSARLSAAMDLQNTLPFLSNVTISYSTFTRNHASHFAYSGYTYCIVYCRGSNVTLHNTSIVNNNGSGFCTQSSKLSISGVVESSRNAGFKGGGIYLARNSWISMGMDSVLILTDNRAVYGGGIYQTTGEFISLSHGVCFLVRSQSAMIKFSDNNAYSSGDDIYLNTPHDNCDSELANLSLPSSKVSSSVYSIKLNAVEARVILGQRLLLSAFVTDYFGKPTSTAVDVYLLPKDGNLFNEIPYYLQGFTSFTFNNGSNNPEMFITGPDNTTSEGAYNLVLSTAQGISQIDETVSLTIIGCSLGFTYVPSTGICTCASTNIECDFNLGTACVRKGYWHGNIRGIDDAVTAPCASGNCENINNCTVCPSKGLTTFCLLPLNEASECRGKWTGPLCTECEHDYSYTFLAKQCVKSSTCTGAAALIPTILILIYLITVTAVIFIILKLGYHTQSGYIYCIVYYFSIVELLLPKNEMGGGPLKITVSIFQSILQLNSYFLGYIPVCVSPRITIIEQGLLLYLNPLIVSIAIVGIVTLSKRCSKYININDNSVPKAISLLILLSFTTLTETSFNILIPIKYDSSESVYVKLQPSTKYLDPSQHLPWWLIAITVLSFFVIPFTVLLMFAPLLVRCVNLTKVKPFLDEFQGCFKDRYRWMAGYYFLCRIIVFISITVSVSQSIAFEYIAMILSLFILFIHMAIQPYQNRVLNIMDSLLLADLVCLSLLYTTSSEIASEEVHNGQVIRQILTYLLVILPMIYTITIATIAIVRKLPTQIKHKVKEKYDQGKSKALAITYYHVNDHIETPLIDEAPESDQQSNINSANADAKLAQDYSVNFREPLLDSVPIDEGSVRGITRSVIGLRQ